MRRVTDAAMRASPSRPSPPPGPPPALWEAARAACLRARQISPGRLRGAALLAADGTIVASPELGDPAGSGAGACAERAVLYRSLFASRKRPRDLLIRGGPRGTADGGPPCGACLQVLFEFAPGLRVWWGTPHRPRGGAAVRDLLPGAFGRRHLARSGGGGAA